MTPTRSTTWSAARQRQALDLSARYRHGASVNDLARTTGLSKGRDLHRRPGGGLRVLRAHGAAKARPGRSHPALPPARPEPWALTGKPAES